jgi:hypothetical protein
MITLPYMSADLTGGLLTVFKRTGSQRCKVHLIKTSFSGTLAPTMVWADLRDFEATFKGYSVQLYDPALCTGPDVVSSAVQIRTDYVEFDYDSGAGGDADDEVLLIALCSDMGSGEELVGVWTLPDSTTFSGDGDFVRFRLVAALINE